MRFFLVLVLTLFAFTSPLPLYAQEEATSAANTEVVRPLTYTLPYPGMLPDSPLYPFKMLRDRIVLFLIADPAKKAEFNLLQADKRLQAGVYLWNEKPEKADLVISTISKGENYFEQAIFETKQAKREGRETGSIKGDLEQAARKHKAVIARLRGEMLPSYTEALDILEKRVAHLTLQVKALE